MKRSLFAIFLIWLAAYFYYTNQSPPPPPAQPAEAPLKRQKAAEEAPPPPAPIEASHPTDTVPATPHGAPVVVGTRNPQQKIPVLPYKLENGLIVVQGDTVVGAPTRPDLPPNGLVQMEPVNLWPRAVIPYHIQPNVENPDRVKQALAMFDGTAIHFVPQSGEEDVLVFEQGENNCLSYVGKVGGKQPIWLAPNCKADDIAHEILHALGFVHEQNRADRDDFVTVIFANIDERYKDNFEKLPAEFMKVSGLAEFDFQSLMLYPAWMFAKNGQSTMEPRINDKLIQPSTSLSVGDIERLNRAYSR